MDGWMDGLLRIGNRHWYDVGGWIYIPLLLYSIPYLLPEPLPKKTKQKTTVIILRFLHFRFGVWVVR